jgi:hypothetical protein
MRVKDRPPNLPGLATFSGPSGYGKSMAAIYTANKTRAYHVQCKSVWTRKSLCQAILAEMGIRDPDLHQSIRDAHQRYVDALTSQIANGVELGTFRKVDPRQTALLLKMIIDGIEQGLALGYDIDVNALLPAGLDVLLGGLLSRE